MYAIDYPLAPERPFPAALLSTLRAIAWVKQHSGCDEVDLLGDSAGGNLATMVCPLPSFPFPAPSLQLPAMCCPALTACFVRAQPALGAPRIASLQGVVVAVLHPANSAQLALISVSRMCRPRRC